MSGKEFMCNINNNIDDMLQNDDTLKNITIEVKYHTIDPKTELNEEEATSLQELIQDVMIDTYRDVVTVFPEINGLDISIYKSEEGEDE